MVDFYGFSCSINILYQSHGTGMGTLRESNIAMENPPWMKMYFLLKNGDFPLLCLFTGGYLKKTQTHPLSSAPHLHRHKDFQLPNPCHALLSCCWKHDGFLRLGEVVVVTNFVACIDERHEVTGKQRGNQKWGLGSMVRIPMGHFTYK